MAVESVESVELALSTPLTGKNFNSEEVNRDLPKGGYRLIKNELTAVVVPLLKGVVYRDEDGALWTQLLAMQAQVADYVAVLALDLTVDEAEGYAFLRARAGEAEEDDQGGAGGSGVGDSGAGGRAKPPRVVPRVVPRLVRRQPLSFQVSLLLALLRKKMTEFDASGGDTRLIVSRDQIVELIRVFLPLGSNESRLIDQVDTHLNKVIELGFVRKLKPSAGAGKESMFEVRRILKAYVDAQWLADFDQRLGAYLTVLSAATSDAGATDES